MAAGTEFGKIQSDCKMGTFAALIVPVGISFNMRCRKRHCERIISPSLSATAGVGSGTVLALLQPQLCSLDNGFLMRP
jgi:hypothetical protein